jgi:hypothetical protein
MFAPTASGASLVVSIGKRGTTAGARGSTSRRVRLDDAVERPPVPLINRRYGSDFARLRGCRAGIHGQQAQPAPTGGGADAA